MKNWQVAELGLLVRAMAIVPRLFDSPLPDSFLIGGRLPFCFLFHLVGHPAPLDHEPGITRWKIRLS